MSYKANAVTDVVFVVGASWQPHVWSAAGVWAAVANAFISVLNDALLMEY